jgi:hypothetical protein
MTTETVAPNTLDGAATQHNAIPSLEDLASKMTAMRTQVERNRPAQDQQLATGTPVVANADEPVAPESVSDTAEPEIADTEFSEATATDEVQAQNETVSDDTTSDQEIIDFLEFADSNPAAKFKFMRNGKEMIIDAKKAAAILGQGGAIHEEARELKVRQAEFEEYERDRRSQLDGLTLAMEFTIQPQLQSAYDEIMKTQGYQATFQQQLAQARDPAQQARIQASMQQNERYIAQQSDVIRSLKPRVDQFYDARRQQVTEVLDNNRRQFKDKELKNEYVYKELRDKISKGWAAAHEQLVPGVENIDLIASDEYILSLVRDGLKFRNRPEGRSAGASIAQLQTRKASNSGSKSQDSQIQDLRNQAKGGDKKAADNLLLAQLQKLRQSRRG